MRSALTLLYEGFPTGEGGRGAHFFNTRPIETGATTLADARLAAIALSELINRLCRGETRVKVFLAGVRQNWELYKSVRTDSKRRCRSFGCYSSRIPLCHSMVATTRRGTRCAFRDDVLERHCRDAGRDPNEIEKGYRGPIVVTDNQSTIDRVAAMLSGQYGLTDADVKEHMPVGTASHVRAVVARYAEVGVRRMIMLSQAPWKQDTFLRINAEVVEAFV